MGERADRARTTIKDVVDHDVVESQSSGVISTPVGTSENPSNAIFTIANCITFGRLALTLVFLYFFVRQQGNDRTVALACYIVAACTDFLDGQVARRTQTVSWLGKVMDPIMDRVLLFTGVLGLLAVGELPLWVTVLVISRDVILAIGMAWLRKFTKRPMDVVFIGKLTTALLMSGFSLLLIGIPQVTGPSLVSYDWLPGFNGTTVSIGIYLVYAGLVFSVITAIVYYLKGLRIRKQALLERARSVEDAE